jgi:hypothetical protein
MAQTSLTEAFADCVNRINLGQTVEECLRIYPQYAKQLQGLLETVETVKYTQISSAEIFEDQNAVWQQIEGEIPDNIVPMHQTNRRINIRLQLLIAVVLLLLLTMSMWFLASRPDIDDTEQPVPVLQTITVVPTMTLTVSPSPTTTPSVTQTIAFTPTYTQTDSATPTAIPSSTPTLLATPTTDQSSTLPVGACGELVSYDKMVKIVEEIYPNTKVIRSQAINRSDGRIVWDISTSHDIDMVIDAECGYVLTIERSTDPQPSVTPLIAIIDENNPIEQGQTSSNSSNASNGLSNDEDFVDEDHDFEEEEDDEDDDDDEREDDNDDDDDEREDDDDDE